MMKIFYRLILLVLLIIGHAPVYAAVVNCTSLVGDNSTNNSSILADCISKAEGETEKEVSLPVPASAYRFTSDVTVSEGVTLTGAGGGATINMDNSASIRLSDYSKLDNLIFQGAQRSIVIGESTLVTGAEVRNCTFASTTWAHIVAYRINDCIIDNNTINNTGSGSNIQILGGKRNRITNNNITGGMTCIIFKYDRRVNGGGYDSLIEDNIVRGNTCSDPGASKFEEGISFDVVGDNSGAVASLEYDTVASVSGNQVTLSHANWAPTGNPSYVGYDMIFLSGDMIGQTSRITAQSTATFTLADSAAAADPGDEIVIGAAFKRNIVDNNTLTTNEEDSILFYGMSFQNIIINNNVSDRNISIRSLDNLAKATNNVTGTWGRAPSGYNLIKDNTVGGRVVLQRYAIPVIKGHSNTYSPYYSYGNSVIDNKVGDRIWANNQYCYLSGNTGTTELYHVTFIINPPVLGDTKGIDPPLGLRIYTN